MFVKQEGWVSNIILLTILESRGGGRRRLNSPKMYLGIYIQGV